MTTFYYIPPENIFGATVTLPADEARHAVQVLRQRAGDEIEAVNGLGDWFRVELTHVDKRNVTGKILETKTEVGENDYGLTLAVGILKNQKRYEIFVEKACELGVTRIIPFISKRSEKKSVRKDRLQNILVAGMKQSGRSRLVEVREATEFTNLVALRGYTSRLICHEAVSEEDALLDHLKEEDLREVLIAIGPEGGFTEGEVEMADAAGFRRVSLGPRRLRTETAALTATAAITLFKSKVKS